MKVKFNVPTSKHDVLLSQFQEFQKIQDLNKESDDDTFLLEKMVSIFCEVDMKDLRSIRYDHYEVIVEELTKAFESKSKHKQIIEVAGQKFGMIPNFDEMSFGEYVDIDEYSKNVADYHKLMAVLYRPITAQVKDMYEIEPYEGSGKYADLMKHASLADTEGALLFFWTLANELLEITNLYLQGEKMRTNTPSEQTSDGSTDGINPSLHSRLTTLLESARLQSSTFINAFTSYNLIKSVWTSSKESLKELETKTNDETVLHGNAED